jgi:hypothetical protein
MNRLYALLLTLAVCNGASAQLRLPPLGLPSSLGPLDRLRPPV